MLRIISHLHADLVSSVSSGLSKEFINSQSIDQHSFGNMDLQDIMKCLYPRPFSRSMFNKGLHHANSYVKHGTLRLLLELLKLLDSLFNGLNHNSSSSNPSSEHIVKQEIQNYVQPFLPDMQVLLNLLSSLDACSEAHTSNLKRNADHHEHGSNARKKLKIDTSVSDIDIIVGGISAGPDLDLNSNSGTVDSVLRADALDDTEDLIDSVGEIWGVDLRSMGISTLKHADSYLLSKLLDALKYFGRTLPFALDNSIESFKSFLKNPLELTGYLQVSLLSLLVEYIEWCPDNEIPIKTPPMLYKYLEPFLDVLMFSQVDETKDLAYRLAMAAMFSTGAFDRNLHEIEAWFLFLPGYHRKKLPVNIMEVEVLRSLSSSVVSFLCDAVSTIGNNLVKYWNIFKSYVHCLECGKDSSPDFSPFILCVMEKCLKVIRPKSGTCSWPKKSMVLLYTCNTVKYLLQTQVNAELLAALVNADLTERLGGSNEYNEVFPEWKPLKNLLDFVKSISHQQNCLFSKNEESVSADGSLGSALGYVNKSFSSGVGHGMAETILAFVSSTILEGTDKIATNLAFRAVISQDYSVILHASELCPVMFYAGLDMVISDLGSDSRNAAPIGTSDFTLCPDSLTCNQLLDPTEADAAAFGIVLKQIPFHVIYPAIMCMNDLYISKLSKIQELLLHKLSESINDCSLLLNLQLVLFWTHHIQLSYKDNPLAEIKERLNLCVILVRNLLAQLLVPGSGSEWSTIRAFSSSNSQQVIKTIFCHPCVPMSLSFSLGSSLANGYIGSGFDMLNVLSREGLHEFGNPILNILTMTLDYMWSLFGTHRCASKAQDVANNFMKSFEGLQQKLFLDFREQFELCVCSKDMMPLPPTLCTLHALHQFLNPFQLLELVDWMFNRVELEVDDLPTKISYLSVGCSLATDAFRAISIFFQQSSGNRVPYDLFWKMGEKVTKGDIFEKIYSKVVDFSVNYEIDCADRCLHEAVNALYKQKHMQQEKFHPLLLVMWKVIGMTPVQMLSHCIHKTNPMRSKFIHILTELSSLHSSIFGQFFLGIVNISLHHDIGVMGHAFDVTLSEDQFILLLPASLSYLSLISKGLGENNHKDFKHIPYFYSKILLKGFSQGKSFFSKNIFEEEFGEFLPSSVQELLSLIDRSLLGKSIHMLQYHFALHGDSVKLKKRLKLFKSICPKFASLDMLMDCDCQDIDSDSLHQSLNVINHVVAKMSLCKLLLFHEVGEDLKEAAAEKRSKLEVSKMHFINILVDIWQFIVKKFSLASGQCGAAKRTNISLLYNHLEAFVLQNILELAVEMKSDLIQLQSIPFLEQFFRCALLYRFNDPTTMKTLRLILTHLNEGRLPYELYLQLLVAHSQFAPTLHSVRKPAGSLLKPVSSILKCLVIPSPNHYENNEEHKKPTTELTSRPLEIVKLLWILLRTKNCHAGLDAGNDVSINLKELHALLLHSYGATLSQIDLGIYNLMQHIESMTGSRPQNALLISDAIAEWTRSQHGDNYPIDPDICVSTVLYFPYDRSISDEPSSLNKIEKDTVRKKIRYSHVEVRERYDPAFILNFSIHSLSKAYIEPVEFAGSGLLAIAFVSMSSPDYGIRRLAYGTLDKLKNVLEKCQKRKDMIGLRLLLNSIQNSIEEPWQRIPSVIALFAAEASCVLLDSSHDHYAALSTLLIHSSKLDMRAIPLFDNFFWSTSVNFKAERIWMLRLVYAGLNSDDDAMIYIRNSTIESLMSFYVSPLSDVESKGLIIEVLKKSVRLNKIARHLVKQCSLFSWFSCIISVTRERLNGEDNRVFLRHVSVILKVVNDVISFESISKWLQNYGLEQLMELSSTLFHFLLRDVSSLAKETVGLVNPFLQMIASMLKLSQKRKVYQPHFTLSIEGLYQIYQAGSVCNQPTENINPEFVLEAILMNAPPVSIFSVNQERLQSFLDWAVTTALQSESSQRLRSYESRIIFTNNLGEESHDDSLVSKLLRWLTASVIMGKVHQKSNDIDSGLAETNNLESLHSLLVRVENSSGQGHGFNIGGEELLASTIFYLQQQLGINQELLPSVVSALCLLIFGSSNFPVGRTDLLRGYNTFILSHCLSSRVRCPPEADPAWRWLFDQPWKDQSRENTDSQKMEEYHACMILLVIVANVLSGKKLESANFLL
ncbi:uncharacterized protein LOC130726425 isoform X4 [Lotus japonicus]|uniref:uncharacterized protein LOC130726425 isoform X4 n=1 Tax=Lotus japonicus TaxID=34305 RepID=UPI00258936C6|nr:uncharacterized protein LOC130726425 isoform X4 [Lotus japonicus]